MGFIKDAIMKTYKEMGMEVEFLNHKPQVLETPAQAKYNDIRRVERNYTHGVSKARKEAGRENN